MKKIILFLMAVIFTTGLISFEKNLEAQSWGSKNRSSKVPQINPAANIQNAVKQNSSQRAEKRQPNAQDAVRTDIIVVPPDCEYYFERVDRSASDYLCDRSAYECLFDAHAYRLFVDSTGFRCPLGTLQFMRPGSFSCTWYGDVNISPDDFAAWIASIECPSGYRSFGSSSRLGGVGGCTSSNLLRARDPAYYQCADLSTGILSGEARSLPYYCCD